MAYNSLKTSGRLLEFRSQTFRAPYVNEKTAVFVREKVAYWRKNYHVQGFFYDALDCVENTGYYLLSEEVLTKFNAEAYENGWDMLPVEAPTEDSALFYWEWY